MRDYFMRQPGGLWFVGEKHPQPEAKEQFDGTLYTRAQTDEFIRTALIPIEIVGPITASEAGAYWGRKGGKTITPARCEANRKRALARHRAARKLKKATRQPKRRYTYEERYL